MLFRKHKNLIWITNFFLSFLYFLIIYSAQCQPADQWNNDQLDHLANTITRQDLKRYMKVLTADSLEGRETGEPGQKKAANYIRNQFKKFGLFPVHIDGKDTYDQVFPFENKKILKVSVTVGNKIFYHSSDFIHVGRFNSAIRDTVKIKFAGYGTHEDLDKIQPGESAILFMHLQAGISLMEKIKFCRDAGIEYIFIIYGDQHQEFKQFLKVSEKYEENTNDWVHDQKKDSHVFFISPSLGANIFNTNIDHLVKAAEKRLKGNRNPYRKFKDTAIIIHADLQDSLRYTENILGFIKGVEKPDECIILSAHYDHLGIRGGSVYHGADDNASGTASLLELAEAFSLAPAPRRSILFIAFTGEEKGLLGSDFYVNHPVFPLSKTLVDLNIDMIGRTDSQHSVDTGYVYLIGSDKLSLELHEISERLNRNHTNLVFDYTYNEDKDPNRFYYRSDQYNFAKYNIPAIFYFTGVHEDYHKPTDTIEKINFGNLVTISQLIFYTTWDIANRGNRINLK